MLVYFFNDTEIDPNLVKQLFQASKLISEAQIQTVTLITPFIHTDLPKGVQQLSEMMGVTADEVPSLWFVYQKGLQIAGFPYQVKPTSQLPKLILLWACNGGLLILGELLLLLFTERSFTPI